MRTYLARLGDFQFGIDTAAFQELQRSSTYRWEAKNRIGRQPAQQNTGRGADTITLSGVIYPHWRGGLGQIAAMRAMAASGQPMPLVYAFETAGEYCGLWCVTSVQETRTVFFDNGAPRRIDFNLTLVEYGEDADTSIASQVAAIASAAIVGDVDAAGAATQSASLASETQAVATQADALGMMAKTAAVAQGVATTISDGINAVLNSDAGRIAQRAVREVNNLQAQARALSGAVKGVAGIADNPATALGALGSMAATAGGIAEAMASVSSGLSGTGTTYNGATGGSLHQKQIASATGTLTTLSTAAGSLQTAASTLRGFF